MGGTVKRYRLFSPQISIEIGVWEEESLFLLVKTYKYCL